MLHVLLIEDNPGDALLVQEAIRSSELNAVLLIAYDGEQALRLLSQPDSRPDVILLDLNIPKIAGIEILERQRASGGAPIIVLTSSANPAEKERAMNLGAKEYLQKPLELASYIETICGAIERWTSES